MKANELHSHMASVGTWVDWKRTSDRFLAGDPEATVKGIAVSWMPTVNNLRRAWAKGANLFVAHEPLYISDAKQGSVQPGREAWAEKKRWLDETGMVVYRCHDVWDDYPEIGVHGAWADFLGLTGKPVASSRFYEVHEVGDLTLRQLAERILEKARALGQETVHMVGDPNKKVSRIALGTGAITDYREMFNLGADVLLLTDDGTRLWESGQWSLDAGIPLLLVNHSTAEEPAMRTLTRYIQERPPEVPVEHIPVGCLYAAVHL
ncbi:MAG: Nif3-like dinuclear metal center hexameric protein [Candidatus Bathyarchaeia archaeon]